MSEPVRWIEARVLAPEGWLELVAEALAVEPRTGAAFGRSTLAADPPLPGRDYVRVFLPEGSDSPGLRQVLAGRVADLHERTGAQELAGLTVEFRAVPPEDFATSWRKGWKPFRVGNLCVVLPGGAPRTRRTDRILRLEPGGAFGSGRHPTTRACLREIQARVQAGAQVLDAGSGSGILAVSAVLLGAAGALGFDEDPVAKPYAEALAAENGATSACKFLTCGFEVLDGREAAFDGVVANIYADVIGAEIARISRALRGGGWFVFSGCTEVRALALLETISTSDLRIEKETTCGRWHTFSGTRIRA